MNLAYLVALQSIDGLGPIRLKMLLDFYKDPLQIWKLSINDLKEFKIPYPVLKKLEIARKAIDPQAEFEKIINKGIKVISLFDERYPANLKQIYNPPILLYYAGKFPDLTHAIGVVGTRKISGYGRTVTRSLTKGLVDASFVIISGLARGVDTVAHQTAIDEHGFTVAVLGGGLNHVFPSENRQLAFTIAEKHGAVISEYHPDAPALPGNFPSRNRIISGLSQAVLVTEATEDSGSLITAQLAVEQGRQVYAVPGPINASQSIGPLTLIRDGAKLVTRVDDILEDFGSLHYATPERSVDALSELEYQIIQELSKEKQHVDELTRVLQLPSAKVASSLLKLEIEGFVASEGNGVYSINL